LKPREAIVCVSKIIKTENSIADIEVLIEVDHPNNDIYKVEGTVIMKTKEKFNFDINNILLRVYLFIIL